MDPLIECLRILAPLSAGNHADALSRSEEAIAVYLARIPSEGHAKALRALKIDYFAKATEGEVARLVEHAIGERIRRLELDGGRDDLAD